MVDQIKDSMIVNRTEIIKWFVDEYKPAYSERVLKTSVSCYDANTLNSCGACESCRRKYEAIKPFFKDSWKWFEKDIRKWKK